MHPKFFKQTLHFFSLFPFTSSLQLLFKTKNPLSLGTLGHVLEPLCRTSLPLILPRVGYSLSCSGLHSLYPNLYSFSLWNGRLSPPYLSTSDTSIFINLQTLSLHPREHITEVQSQKNHFSTVPGKVVLSTQHKVVPELLVPLTLYARLLYFVLQIRGNSRVVFLTRCYF